MKTKDQRYMGVRMKPGQRAAIREASLRSWAKRREQMPIGYKRLDATHGYVLVKVVEGSGRWRPEHIMVMERRLGGPLPEGSQVHHVDGDRSNNDDSNLYLCRDGAHHMEIEHQIKDVFRELLKRGLARFCPDRGIYVVI